MENFVARPPFWQDWDVKTDVAILSSQEVAGFLKNNLTLRKEFHEKMTIKDVNTKSHEQRYLVMRFVDDHSPLYGKIKCYFSCFSHSITNSLKLRKGVPTVIILPFPSFLEKDKKHPCKARLRWGMIEHAGK
ncbi:MAG: hypothetical protein FJZ58_01895 [Chlamydiae bacterium]|nr:hypothetical protein [Chlamydiota bacterium]